MLSLNTITFEDFYFNGKWLSSLGGRIAGVDGLPTFSVLPALEIKTEKVIGRDGEFAYSSSYQPRTFTIPVLFSDITRIRDIASWLYVKQPTYFYLSGDNVKIKVMLDGVIDIKQYAFEGIIDLKFIAHDPYFIEVNPRTVAYTSDLTNLKTFINTGNVECYPLVKFIGNGDITFEINNSRYRIKNVIDYVYLDCCNYTVYKGDPNDLSGAINKLQDFYKVNELSGAESYPTTMPILTVNNNTFKLVSGNCTEIDITNRTRWI